jgi:hypothetical protein
MGPGDYDLCPVCFWEDDGMHEDDAASMAGPNGMTLAEGQRLYRRYGTSALHALGQVRPPAPSEPRDPDWRPVPRPAEEDNTQFFLSDLGQLLKHSTEEALETARRSRSEFDIGRFDGLRSALSLLIKQADGFKIARRKVGIDPQLNVGRDLRLDPPPGYFAG